MAPPAGTLRVGRYFLALGILLAVLYGLTFFPGSRNTPSLGLDLVGGAQVVLQASTEDGSTPTRDSMNEARTIIEDRVNGRGVSNSQVAIEGSDRITVTIPGRRADDIDDIGNTALLNFRPVVAGPFPATPVATTPTAVPTDGATPTDGSTPAPSDSASATIAPTSAPATGAPTTAEPSDNASAQDEAARPLAAATTPAPTAAATDPAATAAATDPAATAAPTDPAATAAPTDPAATDPAAAPTSTAGGGIATVPGADAVTPDQVAAFQADQTNASVSGATTLDTAQIQSLIAFQCGTTEPATATDQNIVACTQDGSAKYVLAPQIFPGTEISNAAAIAPNAQTAAQGWTVSLDLKSNGARLWADYTGANNCGGVSCTASSPPASFVAFTLDGEVITAPGITSAITGQTQISGSFTEESASDLANSLKYGALPLSFEELTSQTVSATLGTSQLEAGLLAGGIGLALVVVYSLLYYRGLGLVTLASLAVSGAIVYASLVILGNNIGFTLTLAGVAGFIVAVGITADSFVVFFERIKDEVHEGRSMRVAVPRAWTRARRTVISADVVSLLAAVVLYFLAAGEVRGFAFTLGLSTIIDVIVVFWFTHPLVSLLSRSKAFGSKRFTGLDSVRTGTAAPTKPAPGRRPARPARPAAAASAGTVVIEKPSRSSVAVLERDEEPDTDDAPEVEHTTPVAEPAPVETTEDVADSAVPDDDVVTSDADPAADDDATPAPAARARRSTTSSTSSSSATGSAAERAAARRAKLRSDQTPTSAEDGA